MVMPLQSRPAPKSHAAPHHAKAIAPEMGHAIDSKGNRFQFGPHAPAHVGPDTIIILHGRPPQRAHQHYKENGGKLPPEVMKHVAPHHRHPGEILKQLAGAVDKAAPKAHQRPKTATQLPPQMPNVPMGPQLPMGGGL